MLSFKRLPRLGLVSLLVLLASATFNVHAEQDKQAEKYTWDLTELYPDQEAWHKARNTVLEQLKDIESYKGKLGKNHKTFYAGMQLISDVQRQLFRVYVYANLLSDEDLQIAEHQELDQLAQIAYAKFSEAVAWVNPEILAIGEKKINKFLKKEPRLEPYRFGLDDTLRSAAHTLDDDGEALLALFTQPMGAPSNIYSLIANSDIPWPEVKMSDGKTHRIDSAGYSRWRASPDRDERKKAFDIFWTEWQKYRSSVGSVLNAHVQNQVALSRARGYDSVLQRELDQDNLPEDIYRTLVKEVNNALPTLHRYFKLRTQMLGIDQMHYYDIYPPLVSLDKKFDYETSNKITLDAMSVLGEDWISKQKHGMSQRWVHVHPQKGKRSGAYMSGYAYDVHPYILLNHNDTYDSLSTLAHEWGHAMHTLFATEAQPFQTYRYTTFIAEIPSTSLELILQHYMVKNAESVDEKIFYLGSGLERMRATLFRQTMFAEFELSLYEAVENGEALSGDKISKMYGEILRRYHGHDEGVVVIDDLYANEWMFVPHFYYNMYVYQYATSVTAGTALFERIMEEGDAGVENYINLLRAGGSDYPHNLLKNAGVDLTKPDAFRAIIKRMNLIMDEMERLLAEKEKAS